MLREVKQFSSHAQFHDVKAVLERGFASRQLRKPPMGNGSSIDLACNESTYEFYEDRMGNLWMLSPPSNESNGSLRLYYRKPELKSAYEKKAELDVMFMTAGLTIGIPIALIYLFIELLRAAL